MLIPNTLPALKPFFIKASFVNASYRNDRVQARCNSSSDLYNTLTLRKISVMRDLSRFSGVSWARAT